METTKPRLPKDPKKAAKIKNLIFWLAIVLMLGSAIFFFWRGLTLKPSSSQPTPSTPEQSSPTTTPSEPEGQVYIVKSGDTLYGIAKKFGVSVDDLVKANNIKDPNKLSIGDKLIIPSSTGGATSSTTTTTQPSSQEMLP